MKQFIQSFKLTKALFTIAFILVCGMLFAQGGTTAPATDIFSFLAGFIPVKYQALAITVLTGLYLLEQFLAGSSRIKANSTFQLIGGFISRIYNSVVKPKP